MKQKFVDSSMERACAGCGLSSSKAEGESSFYQCPLCQEMGDSTTKTGFFCSQACFAKNWLEHRNTVHQNSSGEQRKKQREKKAKTDETAIKEEKKKNNKKAAKRRLAEVTPPEAEEEVEEGETEEALLTIPPWEVLPAAAACQGLKCAIVEPSLSLTSTKKAIIACSAGEESLPPSAKRLRRESMEQDNGEREEAVMTAMWWSAATAMAHLLQTSRIIKSKADSQLSLIVVVAGNALTAHAFAWAARCAGLAGHLRLHVEETVHAPAAAGEVGASASAEAAGIVRRRAPKQGFYVVITTERAYHAAQSDAEAVIPMALQPSTDRSVSSDVEDSSALRLLQEYFTTSPSTEAGDERTLLLATLPDVSSPEELQRIDRPAFFFVGEDEAAEGEASEDGPYTHRVRGFAPSLFPWMRASFRMGHALLHLSSASEDEAQEGEALKEEDEEVDWELDDRVSTCLANGDDEGALRYFFARYQAYVLAPQLFEATKRRAGHSERMRKFLVHSFRCNWGALNIPHAHQRFVDISRGLLGYDEVFSHHVSSSVSAAALAQTHFLQGVGEGSSMNFFGASTTSSSPAVRAKAAAALYQQQVQLRRVGSVGGGLTSGSRSLADVVLKCLVATCTTLPRIVEPSLSALVPPKGSERWYDSVKEVLPDSSPQFTRSCQTLSKNYLSVAPTLQLQAFLSFIFPYLFATSGNGSSAQEEHPLSVSGRKILDVLGERWGVERVMPGYKAVLHSIQEAKKTSKKGQPNPADDGEQSTAAYSSRAMNVALSAALKAVERVELRVSMKQSLHEASFMATVVLLLFEMLSGFVTMHLSSTETAAKKKSVATYSFPLSLSLEELSRRLQWNGSFIAHHWDSLSSFLEKIELLHGAVDAPAPHRGAKARKALSGRQTAASLRDAARSAKESLVVAAAASPAVQYLSGQPVRLPPVGGAVAPSPLPVVAPLPYPWSTLPIADVAERRRMELRRLAAEEILSAMPKEAHKPMYIGDLGNLIGKWNHFNARYDGALGVRLQDFLEAHPSLWKVAGTLVTRRKAGTVEPVKIRFDDNAMDDQSGSDDEGGARSQKSRDREALTGLRSSRGKPKRFLSKKEKEAKRERVNAEKSSRSKKKNLVKEFNRSRNNRNYKQIDPSARVPGYVKKTAGKIKGRGQKVNIRNYKRGN